MDPALTEALARPDNLVFPSNQATAHDLLERGGRAVRESSGHLIFYGPHGRRLLATDPLGHPLHECEWAVERDGSTRLIQARVHLDWGQWVGLKPEGLVTSTTLDLSRRSGWQRLAPDDLRQMAGQAMGVPLEEVQFFYGDRDLLIDDRGQATIRHRKDAWYVLKDGRFEGALFMSCMAAMHWDRIDFLPVVELFQSLLPGTGSAAFELIRGLYDDQNPTAPRPLRYRGIPTYPSEAAFTLFSGFFTPQTPEGADPLPIFMDPPRSHEVTWLPKPHPPRRYFSPAHRLCVTIQAGLVRKATLVDDPVGASFGAGGAGALAPGNRRARVERSQLLLQDGAAVRRFPLDPAWGPVQDSPPAPATPTPVDWRAVFRDGAPAIPPVEAFSAVLLYPEDDTEIGEAASQPFVADYLQDLIEQDPALRVHLTRTEAVLVEHFEAALMACLHLDRPRRHLVRYRLPEFAQKHAQSLWNQLARSGHLDWLPSITFLPVNPDDATAGGDYDVLYEWVPFAVCDQTERFQTLLTRAAGSLRTGGICFVVGPPALVDLLPRHDLRLLQVQPVETLPTFQMHRTILPKSRVRAGLTLIVASKA